MSYHFKHPSMPPSRRGCGWGNLTRFCSRCGRVIVGHNRGLCSRCVQMTEEPEVCLTPRFQTIFALSQKMKKTRRELLRVMREDVGEW